MTSLVVWWSELLTTNHEVPGSIPGSTMGIFPCRGRIPVVTMIWVVSRIGLKVETSVTRSNKSINSDWIHERSPRWRGPHHGRQPAHQLIEYLVFWLLFTGEREKKFNPRKIQCHAAGGELCADCEVTTCTICSSISKRCHTSYRFCA